MIYFHSNHETTWGKPISRFERHSAAKKGMNVSFICIYINKLLFWSFSLSCFFFLFFKVYTLHISFNYYRKPYLNWIKLLSKIILKKYIFNIIIYLKSKVDRVENGVLNSPLLCKIFLEFYQKLTRWTFSSIFNCNVVYPL